MFVKLKYKLLNEQLLNCASIVGDCNWVKNAPGSNNLIWLGEDVPTIFARLRTFYLDIHLHASSTLYQWLFSGVDSRAPTLSYDRFICCFVDRMQTSLSPSCCRNSSSDPPCPPPLSSLPTAGVGRRRAGCLNVLGYATRGMPRSRRCPTDCSEGSAKESAVGSNRCWDDSSRWRLWT